MKAKDIQPGDQLRVDDGVVYTVERTWEHRSTSPYQRYMMALVRYEQDGGTDIRSWHPQDDVPLVRP